MEQLARRGQRSVARGGWVDAVTQGAFARGSRLTKVGEELFCRTGGIARMIARVRERPR